MEKIFFMKSLIRWISKNKVFAKVFTNVLRVLGILIALGGLIVWILMWRVVFDLPTSGIVGGIIFQLIYVVAIYMVVHAMFVRANDIMKLKESDYKIIPVISIFLKLMGEIYASFASAMAIGGGILIWFAGGYARELLREFKEIPILIPSYGGETFLSGLLFIIGGLVFAFFAFVSFYLMSEVLVLAFDIGVNIRSTRQTFEKYTKAKVKK